MSGPCSACVVQLGLAVRILPTQTSSAEMDGALLGSSLSSRHLSLVLRPSCWDAFSQRIQWLIHRWGWKQGRNFFRDNSERSKAQASQFPPALRPAPHWPRPHGPLSSMAHVYRALAVCRALGQVPEAPSPLFLPVACIWMFLQRLGGRETSSPSPLIAGRERRFGAFVTCSTGEGGAQV